MDRTGSFSLRNLGSTRDELRRRVALAMLVVAFLGGVSLAALSIEARRLERSSRSLETLLRIEDLVRAIGDASRASGALAGPRLERLVTELDEVLADPEARLEPAVSREVGGLRWAAAARLDGSATPRDHELLAGPDTAAAVDAGVRVLTTRVASSRTRLLRLGQGALGVLAATLVGAVWAVFRPTMRHVDRAARQLEETHQVLAARAEELATARREVERARGEAEEQARRVGRTTRMLEAERARLDDEMTQRRRAELAAAESEARTRLVVDSALDAVITIDTEGIVTDWNPSAADVFGWSRAEMVGRSLAGAIVPPEHRDAHLRGLGRFLATGESAILDTRIELSALTRAGARIPVELSISPIRERDRVVGFAGFLRDITERRRQQRALEEVTSGLRAKQGEVEELVYTVSHDLKSPIVTILGFLGYLRDEAERSGNERMLDSARRIERAGHRVRAIIDDLLELSRIGRVTEKEPEEVHLGPLVASVIDAHHAALEERGVRVEVEEELGRVHGDAESLTRLFDNLVRNALQHACGGDSPRLRIGARARVTEILVFVEDDGPGIPEAAQEKVFGAFQRLGTGGAGSGIGLAIVKRIVEAHQGLVWIESPVTERDRGSTFWIALPRLRSLTDTD